MQQEVRQAQDVITQTTSLVAVKTLLRVALGTIAYIRHLLPEDAMKTTNLRFMPRDDGQTSFSSQRSEDTSMRAMKVKLIDRNGSTEAARMSDYLENGIFDAIEKQYLRSFVFAIYLDPSDPNNLVEAYTFNITYVKVAGTDMNVPVLELSTEMEKVSISGKGKGKETVGAVGAQPMGHLPTVQDVKRSLRGSDPFVQPCLRLTSLQDVIRKVMTATQALEPLPRKRYATFKLYYTPETPDGYEPPNFASAEPEQSRLFFSTHSTDETPEKLSMGEQRSGYHSVDLHVASLASHLPRLADDSMAFGHFTETGEHESLPAKHDRKMETQLREEEVKEQMRDSTNRNIVWSAEDAVKAFKDPERHPEEQVLVKTACSREPIGVKDDNGDIHMLQDGGRKVFVGEPLKQPKELRDVDCDGDDIMDTQPIQQEEREAGPTIEDQIDTLRLGSMVVEQLGQSLDFQMLNTDTQMPESFSQEESVAGGHSSQRMDIDGSSIRKASSVSSLSSVSNGQVASKDPKAESNDEVEESYVIDCTCGDESDREIRQKTAGQSHVTGFAERFIIFGAWGESWRLQPARQTFDIFLYRYMAYDDKRIPDRFDCWSCKLEKDDRWVIVTDEEKAIISNGFRELCLMRRAIQVLCDEAVPQTDSLWAERLGCTMSIASYIKKRLMKEGFMSTEETVTDEFGVLEERQVNTRAGRQTRKTGLKRNTKLVAVHGDANRQKKKRYFQPGGKLEKDILRVVFPQAPEQEKTAQILTPRLVDRTNIGEPCTVRIEKRVSGHEVHAPNAKAASSPTPRPTSKRKYTTGGDGSRKKLKISMATHKMSLEEDFD
ncbi:DNA binding protein [Tulasnella sp. 403]|nr:DNA binding protein [Tulasnella sp. 403]